MMETWERCPRLYNVKHNMHMGAKRVSPALGYGSLVHLGLAEWYKSWDQKAAIQVMLDEEFEDPVKPDGSPDFRTKARAMETVYEYMNYYGDESAFGISEVLFTEKAFKLEDDDGFRWGGVLDGVVIADGDAWIFDHKTTSRFGGEGYWNQFRLSSQMAGYVWAGRELGANVRGVLLNCIVTHSVNKAPHIRFQRKKIEYPEWKINEWKEMTLVRYGEIAWAQKNGIYRPRWDSCVNKYGKCPMHDVCIKKSDSREGTFKADFEPRVWDWMTKEKEKENA